MSDFHKAFTPFFQSSGPAMISAAEEARLLRIELAARALLDSWQSASEGYRNNQRAWLDTFPCDAANVLRLALGLEPHNHDGR